MSVAAEMIKERGGMYVRVYVYICVCMHVRACVPIVDTKCYAGIFVGFFGAIILDS